MTSKKDTMPEKQKKDSTLRPLRTPVFALIGLLICIGPSGAQNDDHPLISKYPESILSRKEVKDFDEYRLIDRVDKEFKPQSRILEGKVTRLFYQSPRGRSTLEIFKNYESALVRADLEVLFKCENKECGPAYAASSWNRESGITTKSGADCRYLAGRISSDQGTAYIAVMVGKNRHQVDIVEVKDMESGLVTVNAEALAADIERTGHVSVYGIYFDTGKSEIKSESKPAMDEIAKMLRQNASLNIYVVGHTDNAGSLGMNMTLSKKRANAVVQALVREYGISISRLSPEGVGPLAPQATNTTGDGRARNRRVELVAK